MCILDQWSKTYWQGSEEQASGKNLSGAELVT